MWAHRALVVVDPQYDFMPGGALAIPEGHIILPIVNALLHLPFRLKVASKDYHPKGHCSFASTYGKKVGDKVVIMNLEQTLWPDHCIQGTQGSQWASELDVHHFDKVIFKGNDPTIDSYSIFFDNKKLRSTGLNEYFRDNHIHEIYLTGVATDYCILFSAIDALECGYTVYLLVDACKGVNISPQDSHNALRTMENRGVILLQSQDIFSSFELLKDAHV